MIEMNPKIGNFYDLFMFSYNMAVNNNDCVRFKFNEVNFVVTPYSKLPTSEYVNDHINSGTKEDIRL